MRRTLVKLVTKTLNLVFMAVFLGFAAAGFIHLTNGMEFKTSLGAAFQDARLALTCPSNLQRQWEFVGRSQTEQIALAQSLESTDHVYRGICLAQQFPPQGWPDIQPSASLTTGDKADPASAAISPNEPTPISSAIPGQTQPASNDSPIPTETASPSTPLDGLKNYMLELINADRRANGLDPVTLGNNPAAQAHAEEMLANSFLSHWGLDGMKPYMRYTLAGGVNYEAENVSGAISPPQPGLRYRTIDPKEELREIQQGYMESPGHRENIVNPLHKKVNLGIACDRTHCATDQQFAGDYVEFSQRPTITSGILNLAGRLSDDFTLVSIQVWYDPPPRPLTVGQLDKTYCYDTGTSPVAFIRKPLPTGRHYVSSGNPFTWDKCLDPYGIPPDTPPLNPGTDAAPSTSVGSSDPPRITASTWKVAGESFQVEANLTGVVEDHGAGVYTILIWGDSGGENMRLTSYSIFLE